MKRISVLYSPIHYILDAKNSGSEFYWAYQLYLHLSRNSNINPKFITGGVRGIRDAGVISVDVFSPNVLNLSLVNILKFYFKMFKKSRCIPESDYSIVHHILPFRIGFSFNLFAILSKKPYVIGPIQSNLALLDNDLSINNARGFDKKKFNIQTSLFLILIDVLSPLFKILSHRTLLKASKVIVINSETKKQIQKIGVDQEKIIVISPGINLDEIKYVPSEKKLYSTFTIICVSYLLKRKGVDLLIKGFAEVVKNNNQVKLIILGDGPQREALEKLVKQLHLDEYVTFCGFVNHSQIEEYFSKSQLFVSMSKAESWGQMYLEAMTAGLPIITSRNIGSLSIVKEGKFGYLIDQGNYLEMAKKILYLIDHPGVILKYSKAAREEVVSHYDWELNIIPRYIDVYKKIIKY